MKSFYEMGWCTGSGGGCSMKDCNGHTLVAPSGVQKEMLRKDDIIVMDDEGAELENIRGLKPSA